MRKFKDVNELINEIKPEYPVYCLRPESIKKSTKFFKDNFPGKVLYAVKTNPNEKIIKQIIIYTNSIEYKSFRAESSGDSKASKRI